MDPNAALALVRRLAAAVITAVDGIDDDATPAEGGPESRLASLAILAPAASELADAIQGLDGWLTRGGFLPVAWQGSKR